MRRNPRRAYDEHGAEIAPMTLGNMRAHSIRSVQAYCEAIGCDHEAIVTVDGWPPLSHNWQENSESVCTMSAGRQVVCPSWVVSGAPVRIDGGISGPLPDQLRCSRSASTDPLSPGSADVPRVSPTEARS
jgi:hypothetical protein